MQTYQNGSFASLPMGDAFEKRMEPSSLVDQ